MIIPLLTFFLSLEAASAKFEADMTFEGPAVEAVPKLGTDTYSRLLRMDLI